MKKKYVQFQNKFFINVPVASDSGADLDYLERYVYAYITKRNVHASTISLNLQINIKKSNGIIEKLKKYGLVYELNNRFYVNTKKEPEFFLFYENNLVYDTTFLPNLEYLSFQQNALYWKLYKYSDPVRGLNNCLTISSKMNIEKITDECLIKNLKFSKYKLKESIKILKKLKLIKIKRSGSAFYFGIQPVTENMKVFWRDIDFNFNSELFSQKQILDLYSSGFLSKK